MFKTTYTPYIKTKQLKEILLRHWHLISEDPNLCQIFPIPPVLAYKRAHNLKDYLVKSRFKTDGDLETTHEVYNDDYLDALLEAL